MPPNAQARDPKREQPYVTHCEDCGDALVVKPFRWEPPALRRCDGCNLHPGLFRRHQQ